MTPEAILTTLANQLNISNTDKWIVKKIQTITTAIVSVLKFQVKMNRESGMIAHFVKTAICLNCI